MTTSPLGGCRSRTAELVLLRFCPPGPLARYVSTSHCARSCSSVSADQSERLMRSPPRARETTSFLPPSRLQLPLAAHRPAEHLVGLGVVEALPGRVPRQLLAAQPQAD